MTDIKERTFNFSLSIIKLCHFLETKKGSARILSSQILRSGTSIGANIEEAHGAFSRADFTYKYSISCKEARETHYWLRLLQASGICDESINPLLAECNELIAILTTSIKKLKQKQNP